MGNRTDKEIEDIVENNKLLRTTLRRIMISMAVHPDCTTGSEFDDYTSIAQDVLDTTEYPK